MTSDLKDIIWTIEGRASRGAGKLITYDIEEMKPYGKVLVARSEKGICFIGLPVENSFEQAIQSMRSYFPKAQFVETPSHPTSTTFDIYGTAMQIAVWQELLKIPYGETTTYKAIADVIGKPTASRAVGNAIGANPVCIYIPCHRVLGSNGNIHGYAWGGAWKERLLQIEANNSKIKVSA